MVFMRAPRAAYIAALALVSIALWTAWLSANPWGETWDLPAVHRPASDPQPEQPEQSEPPKQAQLRPEESTTNPISAYRVSKLHYLIPTTAIKPAVCASVASALLNRYSIPTIVGYKGQGEYDAHAAHIAKLKAAARYLHNLTNALDDDLVMIVDGFDVVAQIPAEAMIQLYFEMMPIANQRVADRYGMTLTEARERGMYQTLLWGTDKGCFPSKRTEPQCWLIPDPPSPHNVWGPKTNRGDLPFSHSKFLNSGTVIGPLGDLRNFLDAANKYIGEVHDQQQSHANSDQLYISKMYARQEFNRTRSTLSEGDPFPGLEGERTLPAPREDESEETEFHITVDFESAFTQTQCHNDRFMHKLKYNNWDNSALMKKDALEEGENFKPYHIPMPFYFYRAFVRIFDSIEESQRPGGSARDWVHSLRLGTNVATRRIFAFYHNTCSKKKFVERFQDFWFFSSIDALLKTATQANRNGDPITANAIDGRMWVDAQHHPQGVNDPEGYGGVFTDLAEESYLSFREACGEYWQEVFKTDLPAEEVPAEEVAAEEVPVKVQPNEEVEVQPQIPEGR